VTIEIVDHRGSWPAEFATIAARLREALGERALRIDHIGSTSVPGLAAKDVIDIQVTVAALEDETLRPLLEAAGFRWLDDLRHDHLPPGLDLDPAELEKRMVVAGSGERRVNVHLRVEGRFNHRYALLFRDYLRAHPEAAAALAEVKRALAEHFPEDADAYYAVKDPVNDVILAAAREWAAATDWTP